MICGRGNRGKWSLKDSERWAVVFSSSLVCRSCHSKTTSPNLWQMNMLLCTSESGGEVLLRTSFSKLTGVFVGSRGTILLLEGIKWGKLTCPATNRAFWDLCQIWHLQRQCSLAIMHRELFSFSFNDSELRLGFKTCQGLVSKWRGEWRLQEISCFEKGQRSGKETSLTVCSGRQRDYHFHAADQRYTGFRQTGHTARGVMCRDNRCQIFYQHQVLHKSMKIALRLFGLVFFVGNFFIRCVFILFSCCNQF